MVDKTPIPKLGAFTSQQQDLVSINDHYNNIVGGTFKMVKE